MYGGKAVEFGTADDVFYNPLHPYTWGLLQSVPRHDVDDKGALCPSKVQPPSLIHLPTGCSFRPRCEYATEECKSGAHNRLVEIEPGHFSACQFSEDEDFIERFSCRRSSALGQAAS
jgi:oligopeptide transport system ATP-binding protein